MSTIAPWRAVQRQNFTNWKELFTYLQLPESCRSEVLTHSHFPLNLPRRLAEKIVKGTLDDPILRQFLPSIQEQASSSHFFKDPVGDQTSRKAPKLLHKYHGRALLLSTSACAMHCRYCFRQHFEYETKEKQFHKELEVISADPTLSEIILSGGDPLSLSNADLKALIEALADISHVKLLRFHTRFPIGIPERIDDEFLTILSQSRLQTVFIIHCNHARELDEEIFSALKKIQTLRIPILCQTVLLKDVNDTTSALRELCENLIYRGIIPYYLHQLDKVQGAMHFEVPEAEGLALVQQLSDLLPGYAVPRYVKELPQQASKVAIS